MSSTRKFDPWAAIGKPNPNAVAIADAEDRRRDAVIEQAERKAIIAEPKLPEPGTEERRVIDLRHERMVRGLMTAARNVRK